MVKSADLEVVSEDGISEGSESYSQSDAFQRPSRIQQRSAQKRDTAVRKPQAQRSQQTRYLLRSTGKGGVEYQRNPPVQSDSEHLSEVPEYPEAEAGEASEAPSDGFLPPTLEEEKSLWEWLESTVKSVAQFFSLRPL